jgi:hypothetical protein
MDPHRLQALLSIHSALVSAAGLSEPARPYAVMDKMSKVQELIMKEINNEAKPEPKKDDGIPF